MSVEVWTRTAEVVEVVAAQTDPAIKPLTSTATPISLGLYPNGWYIWLLDVFGLRHP
jgi:hypothetical protein